MCLAPLVLSFLVLLLIWVFLTAVFSCLFVVFDVLSELGFLHFARCYYVAMLIVSKCQDYLESLVISKNIWRCNTVSLVGEIESGEFFNFDGKYIVHV